MPKNTELRFFKKLAQCFISRIKTTDWVLIIGGLNSRVPLYLQIFKYRELQTQYSGMFKTLY